MEIRQKIKSRKYRMLKLNVKKRMKLRFRRRQCLSTTSFTMIILHHALLHLIDRGPQRNRTSVQISKDPGASRRKLHHGQRPIVVTWCSRHFLSKQREVWRWPWEIDESESFDIQTDSDTLFTKPQHSCRSFLFFLSSCSFSAFFFGCPYVAETEVSSTFNSFHFSKNWHSSRCQHSQSVRVQVLCKLYVHECANCSFVVLSKKIVWNIVVPFGSTTWRTLVNQTSCCSGDRSWTLFLFQWNVTDANETFGVNNDGLSVWGLVDWMHLAPTGMMFRLGERRSSCVLDTEQERAIVAEKKCQSSSYRMSLRYQVPWRDWTTAARFGILPQECILRSRDEWVYPAASLKSRRKKSW